MEGDTKITSVEIEKVKDPKRVEQGKRLAAISREAKERKARERAQQLKQEAKQQQHTSFFNSYAIIPIIGIAFGGYYFLYLRNPVGTNNNENREEIQKEPKKKRT